MDWKRILMWIAVGSLVAILGFMLWSRAAAADLEDRLTGDEEVIVHAEEVVYDVTVDGGESPTEELSHMDTGYDSGSDSEDEDW